MSEICLDVLFEKQCRKNPDGIALILEDGSSFMKYSELDERSNSLASILKKSLETEDYSSGNVMISLMTERNFAMMVGILSILKSGAAYVPVDPAFPPDRQSHIFSHSKSKFLITDVSSYEKALNLGVQLPPVLVIDPSTGKVVKGIKRDSSPDSNRIWSNSRMQNDIAYVLYTSGSTGKPKGVMVTHKGVVNIVNWFADELRVNQNSVILGLTTFCFDISVLEMFMPLFRGATLVIAVSSTQKDPFRLLEVIKLRGVNIVQATPTTFEMMLATGWTGDTTLDFLVGGEAFRPSLVPLITNSHSLRNVYGPTETTIWSSSYNFKGKLPETSGALVVPVGSPISETSFYLVRDGGGPPFQLVKETEKEQEGELFIGGIGVALGYLHAPELTAERFIPNPFGEGYVYRTGDLVKRLDDGNYVFVRRLDDQVKVNGYRIELAEVELGLGSYRSVEQVVVIVRNSQLVAYIKPKKDVEFNSSEIQALKEHAGRSLTSYMLPKHFVIVDSFPQTANGKLDRKALPDPPLDIALRENEEKNGSEKEEDTPTIPGTITMTQHVCGIVEKLRGYCPRPTASLATLGIDSLGSILFVKYLSDSLGGIPIDLKMVYSPGVTIKSLSHILYLKVKSEKPEVFAALNIVEEKEGNGKARDGCDLELGLTSPNNNTMKDFQDNEEEEFDDVILANKRLFEGIRGVLTLLVLWDHFHGHYPSPYTLKADTQLFVILSGFTTCLQLRSTRNSKNLWNWRSFLFTRLIGVFPMLWLTLLVYAPRWYHHDQFVLDKLSEHEKHGHVSLEHSNNQKLCVFLYVIGMQTWKFKECHKYGPQDVYYASVIWNCFLLYALWRVFHDSLTKLCIYVFTNDTKKRNRNRKIYVVPKGEIDNNGVSNVNKTDLSQEVTSSNDSLSILSKLLRAIINNQMPPMMFWIAVIFWGIIILIVFQVLKNEGWFIGYFGSGVLAACLTENAFWLIHEHHKRSQVGIGYSNSNSHTMLPFIASSTSSSLQRRLLRLRILLLRFLPDLIVIAMILIFCVGGVKETTETIKYRFLLLPFLLVLSIVGSVLQSPVTRGGVWRYFVESKLITVIGYCSFPIYLLQMVILNFYTRIVYDDIAQGAFPVIKGGTTRSYDAYYNNNWISMLPWYWKIIGLIILLVICWPIQRYYQDGLIASLTSQYLMWISKQNKNILKRTMTANTSEFIPGGGGVGSGGGGNPKKSITI